MDEDCKFTPGMTGVKTRDGSDVVIYAVYPGQFYPIHGAVKSTITDVWITASWLKNGQYEESAMDLILPVRVMSRWVNVYNRADMEKLHLHPSGEEANRLAGDSRIALWRIDYTPDEPSKPPTVTVEWSKSDD